MALHHLIKKQTLIIGVVVVKRRGGCDIYFCWNYTHNPSTGFILKPPCYLYCRIQKAQDDYKKGKATEVSFWFSW